MATQRDVSDSQSNTADGYSEYGSGEKRPRKTSVVWDHFHKIPQTETSEAKAKCKYCETYLSAATKNGTSHLKRHLERCARRNVADVVVASERKMDNDIARKVICHFVLEGGHPFTTVEERAFRRMIKRFFPDFKPFSRATARRDLMSLYVKEREAIKDILMKTTGRICLTTDNWKSTHTGEDYICVTAHFVDDDWKLHKRILRFRVLDPPLDGLCIANEIRMFLSQWQIEHKILTVTTDNASYNDRMIVKLKECLESRNYLVGDGSFFHVRCCAHILNLIVQTGLTMIEDILSKSRAMIRYVLRSSRRERNFYDIAGKRFHLEVKRKICLDMAIRWNSTWKMMDNLLYFKDVFVYLGDGDRHLRELLISADEWVTLLELHTYLRVFYDVTLMFSAVKSPTANIYFKGAYTVHSHLYEMRGGGNPMLAAMAEKMLGKFDKYWSEYNMILSCAAVLDPRFKVKMVEYCYTKLYGEEEAEKIVASVLNMLESIFDHYAKHSTPTCSPNVLSGVGSSSQGSAFGDYTNFQGKRFSRVREKSQLDDYLEEKSSYDLHSELDILEYWKSCSLRYPELSSMARDILSIPVTSVASESAFSIGGKTICPTRSSLKSKTVQALVCIQDWLRLRDESFFNTETASEEEEEEEDDDDDDFIF